MDSRHKQKGKCFRGDCGSQYSLFLHLRTGESPGTWSDTLETWGEPKFACPKCGPLLGIMRCPSGERISCQVHIRLQTLSVLVWYRQEKKQCNSLFQIICLEADRQMMKVFQDANMYHFLHLALFFEVVRGAPNFSVNLSHLFFFGEHNYCSSCGCIKRKVIELCYERGKERRGKELGISWFYINIKWKKSLTDVAFIHAHWAGYKKILGHSLLCDSCF